MDNDGRTVMLEDGRRLAFDAERSALVGGDGDAIDVGDGGVVYAEDGEDFQEYVDGDGMRVGAGEAVGVEFANARGEWELGLFEGVLYAG